MDAIEVRAFTFSYPGGEPVLANADWSVERGSFTLLVGATGSGKSTLLRCLKPELAPAGNRRGTCRVDLSADEGNARTDSSEAGRSSAPQGGVGFVAQDPGNQMVCDTVWHELAFELENCGVAQDVMRRRVAETVHFLGMEPLLHRRVDALSGGQCQMTAVAAALTARPDVLLLDEPTAQLDPVAAKDFLHLLFRINRELGITVVVATHAPASMLDYATAAARIEDGAIHSVSLGSLQETVALRFQNAAPAPGTSALRLRDAWFRYDRSADWVMRGMDLELAQGGVHALVGSNGCGKTTALMLLAGILKPERGSVADAIHGTVAFLPQNPKALFVCDTVSDELAEWSGLFCYGQPEIDAFLERIGLASQTERHPYDLSGGQQQLLALAKVLLISPDLLLLDEPTKGLDAQAECQVAELLEEAHGAGCTIVMATHDLAFAAAAADDMALLFDGQTACCQPPRGFFEGNLFYRPEPDAFTRLWMGRS